MSSDQIDELDQLLLSWEEGELDSVGVRRLREILRTDQEAVRYFATIQLITSSLGDDGHANLGLASPEPNLARSSVKGPGLIQRLMALAVGVLICVGVGRLIYLEFRTSMTETVVDGQEDTSRGIAIVTKLVDARWVPGESTFQVGDPMMPGQVALESGFAQIEFFCGATLVVEGPARLNLESSELATVYSGRLRAQVPPAARGFSLRVNEMTVVDLGTEFGLEVTGQSANVEVFDGEVELVGPADLKRNLKQGDGVRFVGDEFERTDVQSDQFVDIATLEQRAAGRQDQRYDRWKKWSDTFRRDPQMILYYAFESDEVRDRRLLNSDAASDGELDGAIVGAKRTAGRWPQKTALEFKRPADRVRIQVPGEYGSLTFCAWVRIDSLDRRFNSLFLTDNYNFGEPHWQILESGQLYFSVRPSRRGKPGPTDFKALSKPFWDPALSGKWIHLATVYNVENRQISHFLDGEMLGHSEVPKEKFTEVTRIGASSIGNWAAPTQADESFAIRNINGRIDEFALLGRALSGDEIRQIYENGKP